MTRSGCKRRFFVAASPTPRQKRSRLARASSGPPLASPAASRTALMAPALAPLTASNSRSSSSRRRSSTPQVKAPKAPPPCKASERRRGSLDWSTTSDGAASGRIERSDPDVVLGPCIRLLAELRSLRKARLMAGLLCRGSAPPGWFLLPSVLSIYAALQQNRSGGGERGLAFDGHYPA